jgi:ribosomal protein S18 acetylase RimI-like enzyme
VEGMVDMSSNYMGLFGESADIQSDEYQQMKPAPGTVLLSPGRQTTAWKASDRVTVRVANRADDLDISTLRLSVFTDFSPDMRNTFCARSCQLLENRRIQGATCVVATVPRYASILSPRRDIILGTAECSVHEFHGTSLGQRRLKNSILYITEVAVSPTARRKGIGLKILQVSHIGSARLLFSA